MKNLQRTKKSYRVAVQIPVNLIETASYFILKYVVTVLDQFPPTQHLLNWNIHTDYLTDVDCLIYYGYCSTDAPEAARVHIPHHPDILERPHDERYCNMYAHKGQVVYSVERSPKPIQPLLSDKRFAFDIFTTLFFHWSRYEEYHANPDNWDEYDMLEEKYHLLVQEKIEQIPVVDQLIFTFLQTLGIPHTIPTTIYQLSHDIDAIRQFPSFYKYVRASARTLHNTLSVRQWYKLTRLYQSVLSKKVVDPYNTFHWLLIGEQTDRGDFCSDFNKDAFCLSKQQCPLSLAQKTIYFLAGGQTKHEGFYNISDADVHAIIELAQERGYDIGLHPSYLTWRNAEMLCAEKYKLEQIINHPIHCSRQHFLHFDFRKTPKLLVDAGITEDSTLGYQNRIGFRAGTGFRYPMYDFEQKDVYPLWANPFAVMDVSLLKQLDFDVIACKKMLQHFLLRNQSGTQIVFNVHNSSFGQLEYDGQLLKSMYIQLF